MKDNEEAGKVNGIQGAGDVSGTDAPQSPSRRKLLIGGAAAGAALALGTPAVFAAGSSAASSTTTGEDIRIGFISPQSGPLGLFGQSDPWTLTVIRKALAGGITVNGKNYPVKIFSRDGQSSPKRAGELARNLINEHHVDLMLSTATPETVNPVSDVCEAAAVPSIATNCPLESFFFGRGGKMGQPSPFKWSFDASFGVNQFVDAYLGQWPRVKSNKHVAVMYPNDADGNGFRGAMVPILEKNGYKVIDPGAYADGTTDYSSQIALFKREKCEIYSGVGLPPDIDAFWRQSAQLHLLQNLKIAEMTKSGSFYSQIAPLGPIGHYISAATYWSPGFPYQSPLISDSSKQLAEGYTKATGRIWSQQLGATVALFELGIHALKESKNPHSHSAIRDVIPKINMTTILGKVDFSKGPYPNTATSPMIGAQWIPTKPGSQFALDWLIIDNAEDHNVPIQHKPVPYNGGRGA